MAEENCVFDEDLEQIGKETSEHDSGNGRVRGESVEYEEFGLRKSQCYTNCPTCNGIGRVSR